MEFFVRDPKLLELARELGEALRTGRLSRKDALEAMKAAVRRSFDEKAVILRDVESDS